MHNIFIENQSYTEQLDKELKYFWPNKCKLNLINKMMTFERGGDPKNSLRIGKCGIVKDWFDKNNMPNAKITKCEVKNGVVFIDIDGSIVLDNFVINDRNGGKIDVQIENLTGKKTILNDLSIEELYNRIKDFYESALVNCLGKSLADQEKYIYGKPSRKLKLPRRTPIDELIKTSEPIIRNLPKSPTNNEALELAEQVINRELEYGYYSIDSYSCQMQKYAHILKQKLFGK